jgi:hypothetical protein
MPPKPPNTARCSSPSTCSRSDGAAHTLLRRMSAWANAPASRSSTTSWPHRCLESSPQCGSSSTRAGAPARARSRRRTLARRVLGPLARPADHGQGILRRGGAAPPPGLSPAEGNVATRHATAVQRLVDAGAIVLGKTNVPVAWPTAAFNSGVLDHQQSRDPSRFRRLLRWIGRGVARLTSWSLAATSAHPSATPPTTAACTGISHLGVVPMQGHELPARFAWTAWTLAWPTLARSARDLRLAFECTGGSYAGFRTRKGG